MNIQLGVMCTASIVDPHKVQVTSDINNTLYGKSCTLSYCLENFVTIIFVMIIKLTKIFYHRYPELYGRLLELQ